VRHWLPILALDGGRRLVWRLAVRTRLGRTCARDRSSRVLALGLGHIAVALALAAIAPAVLLLVGPLVLGVPHVIADVRYLIVRGPASLRGGTVIAVVVPLAAMTGLGAVEVMGGVGEPHLEVALGFAAIAIAVATAPLARHPERGVRSTRRPIDRRLVLTAVVAVAIPAVLHPAATMMVVLFGHNIVALAIWCGFTRRTVRLAHRAAIVGAAALGTTAILAGVFDAAPAGEIPRLGFGALDPVIAYRLVVAYAFLQALHYVVWLRLIPSTQATAPAASTFRKSIAGLTTDFGRVGLAAIAFVIVAVPVLALAGDPARVRDGYLSLVLFHAWLELAILAYVLATGERLGDES
jgi:hypothetical protein